jgi:hypothetical protein
MNSASLCSQAGWYDNPIPTRFLAPIDCLKIPPLPILICNSVLSTRVGNLKARLLEERGIDESRHGSRAMPRHRRAFFSDSSSNLELDEVFQISQKLELDLAEWFSKIELERSIDFEDYSIQTPPPLNILVQTSAPPP